MSGSAYGNSLPGTATSDTLTELALDLRWSFNHSADNLWQRLGPELWELTHNPWIVLQTVSQEKLKSVSEDPDFQSLLADLRHERRAAEQPEAGLLRWQAELSQHWSKLRFGSALFEPQGQQYFFQVQVLLDDLDPEAVRVELYAEGQNGGAPVQYLMERSRSLIGAANGFLYTASVPATRPVTDFTPRLIPCHAGAFVPLEVPFILWHESPAWGQRPNSPPKV